MKNVVIIPSRMASTRLPGNPLMAIDGIPMIQRVWQRAIESNIGEVFVACSEIEVHDLIVSNGGKAIMTEPNLPSGTDRVHSAFLKINNNKDIDIIINLQGDMPLINPEHILKVIDPIKRNFAIGTLATNLNDNELNNPNVTKVEVDFKKNEIAQALSFYREVTIENKNLYHHVGIYSYTPDSINTFINLPKSKNEIDLSLEQMRAMYSNIPIGVTYVPEVPMSVDTKEDLINIETNIRDHNDKS